MYLQCGPWWIRPIFTAECSQLSEQVVKRCCHSSERVFRFLRVWWRCSHSNSHPHLELLLSYKDHHFLCLYEWNSWHGKSKYWHFLQLLKTSLLVLELYCLLMMRLCSFGFAGTAVTANHAHHRTHIEVQWRRKRQCNYFASEEEDS